MNASYIFIYIYAAHVKRVRFLTFNVDVKQALDLGPRLHLPLWCLNVVAHCLYLCTCIFKYLCTLKVPVYTVHRLALVSKIAVASAVLMWSHIDDSSSLHARPH